MGSMKRQYEVSGYESNGPNRFSPVQWKGKLDIRPFTWPVSDMPKPYSDDFMSALGYD